MKKDSQNFREFMGTPVGMVICFVVLFYTLTFAVYYFYSPGPEERRQAELENQQTAQAQQNSSITIMNTSSGTQQALIDNPLIHNP